MTNTLKMAKLDFYTIKSQLFFLSVIGNGNFDV